MVTGPPGTTARSTTCCPPGTSRAACTRRRHPRRRAPPRPYGRGPCLSGSRSRDVALAMAGTWGSSPRPGHPGDARERHRQPPVRDLRARLHLRDRRDWVMVVDVDPAALQRPCRRDRDYRGRTGAGAGTGRRLRAGGRPLHHREVLAALLGPWFGEHTVGEVTAALSGTAVLWQRYRTFTELVADPETAREPVDDHDRTARCRPVPGAGHPTGPARHTANSGPGPSPRRGHRRRPRRTSQERITSGSPAPVSYGPRLPPPG